MDPELKPVIRTRLESVWERPTAEKGKEKGKEDEEREGRRKGKERQRKISSIC